MAEERSGAAYNLKGRTRPYDHTAHNQPTNATAYYAQFHEPKMADSDGDKD